MKKWGKRIGYGIGDLGCNLVFSTMASYLMVFYTDVFGITAAAAGTMMLVTKFIDALTDTGMGLIVDRTHTRWGQGRPYFAIGAIPFAVFTFMTFYIPSFSSGGKLIWAYITYCLLCTAYTVVNIPLVDTLPISYRLFAGGLHQQLRNGLVKVLFRWDTAVAGKIALRVKVHHQDAVALLGQGNAEVIRCGRFPRTALLICDCDCFHLVSSKISSMLMQCARYSCMYCTSVSL